MKKMYLLLISLIIFVGCATNTPVKSNPNLPRVKKFKAYPDRNAVALFWERAKNIKGYFIQQYDFKAKKWNTIEVDNPYQTIYVVKNLKPNTFYRFRIATFDERKIPSLAKETTVTTKKTIAPVIPLEGKPIVKGVIKIIFRPHPNERVNRYIIEKYNNKTTKWLKIGEINNRLEVEFIDNKDLKDGEIYKYRIIAKTYDNLYSPPSKPIVVSTYPKPPLVNDIEATNDLPRKIVITWSPVKGAAYYKVYISDTPDGEFTFYKKVRGTQFVNLIDKDGFVRYYKVTAVSPYKTESILDNTQAAMGQTLNIPPMPIVATTRNGNKLTLTIRPQDDRSKYFIIKVKKKKSLFSSEAKAYKTKNSHFTLTLDPKASYIIEVQEMDKYGLISKPNIIEVDN